MHQQNSVGEVERWPAGRNERQQSSAPRVREPFRRDRWPYPSDAKITVADVKCDAGALAAFNSSALGARGIRFRDVSDIVFEARPRNTSLLLCFHPFTTLACQWYKSSVTGPALQFAGGSLPKS